MSINTCDRCDRDLKDPTAKYGWRCEKLMGGGSIYTKTRSPTKAPASDGGGKSSGDLAENPSPSEYLSKDEKYKTFAKEFMKESLRIYLRDIVRSIWPFYEGMELGNWIGSTLESLFKGEITTPDVIVSMMENALEGIGGDLYFVLTHLAWFDPNTELTKAQTIELAKRTAGALHESAQLAMILHGAAKAAMARKTGAAATLEGKGILKPQALMDELANSGVKYTPNDVVMVTKTPNGKLEPGFTKKVDITHKCPYNSCKNTRGDNNGVSNRFNRQAMGNHQAPA